MTIPVEYIIDEQANRKAVVIPYAEWQNILATMEAFENSRADDQAKAECAVATAPTTPRIGVAKGRFQVPDHIDQSNEDIARLFLGETQF